MLVTAEIHDWEHYTIHGRTMVCGRIHKDIRLRWADGHMITTAYVVSMDGDLITTKSGSIYKLIGTPKNSATLDPASFSVPA